jgi:hypothetical protein
MWQAVYRKNVMTLASCIFKFAGEVANGRQDWFSSYSFLQIPQDPQVAGLNSFEFSGSAFPVLPKPIPHRGEDFIYEPCTPEDPASRQVVHFDAQHLSAPEFPARSMDCFDGFQLEPSPIRYAFGWQNLLSFSVES